MSGWRCRRSSMSNNTDRARTRTFSSWWSVICNVRLSGVFRVEECVELICQRYQKDFRECKPSSKIDCRGIADIVREMAISVRHVS